MKKFTKVLFYVFISIIIVGSSPSTYADEPVSVYLNGKKLEFDVNPVVIDGRTLVPMRAIFEALDVCVDWNDETQTAIAATYGVGLEIPINSTIITRNTIDVEIDVPAQLISDRTMVPLRVISEALGSDVEWIEEIQTVKITSGNTIKRLDWNDNYYYYGQSKDAKANGYGALYSISDNRLVAMGYYENNQIQEGTVFYDDGNKYVGKFVDGKRSFGTYYHSNGDKYVGEFVDGNRSFGTYYYSNGDKYVGEVVDGIKCGKGKLVFNNGTYFDGTWQDGKLNGYTVFYNSETNAKICGNYVNHLREGAFTLEYLDTNVTTYALFENDKLVYSGDVPYEDSYEKRVKDYYANVKQLNQDYKELENWYLSELDEFNDYLMNGDPFSTSWAKSIYKSYGVTTSKSYSDNTDSFAIANAQRQQAAIKSQADKAILEYEQTYISNWKTSIEQGYTTKKAILDSRKSALEEERILLGL